MSNIKELIRAEIRKWQSNIEARCPESTRSRDYTKEEWDAIYEYNAYTRILSFLDTLPDEPITSCNELEEAAEKSAGQYYVDGGYSPFPNTETASHIAGFKAGAEWQKAKMISALKNDGELPIEFIDKFHEIDRNAFQNGQKNMKEQMMEGATYNELMELYMAIRDEIIKRHRDAAVNIKEKTMDLKEDTGNESALHQIRG